MRIRAPRVEPRKGPALRCTELVIGYPEHEVAADIQLEIDHGCRAAIVGDNGQGKTTFLRTVVESLEPLGGADPLGLWLRHRRLRATCLYQPARENRRCWSISNTRRPRHEVAGAAGCGRQLPVSRRARAKADLGAQRRRAGPLVPGGLLLSQHNVLVLDEPGNHLDVDTVDALAEALLDYQGTVDVHEPRPAFHETRGHVRGRSPRRPRRRTTAVTTMPICTM